MRTRPKICDKLILPAIDANSHPQSDLSENGRAGNRVFPHVGKHGKTGDRSFDSDPASPLSSCCNCSRLL